MGINRIKFIINHAYQNAQEAGFSGNKGRSEYIRYLFIQVGGDSDKQGHTDTHHDAIMAIIDVIYVRDFFCQRESRE